MAPSSSASGEREFETLTGLGGDVGARDEDENKDNADVADGKSKEPWIEREQRRVQRGEMLSTEEDWLRRREHRQRACIIGLHGACFTLPIFV